MLVDMMSRPSVVCGSPVGIFVVSSSAPVPWKSVGSEPACEARDSGATTQESKGKALSRTTLGSFPGRRQSPAPQTRLSHLSECVCMQADNCGLVTLTSVRCHSGSISRTAPWRSQSRLVARGVGQQAAHFSLLSSIPCFSSVLFSDAISVGAVSGVVGITSSSNFPSAVRRAKAKATGPAQPPLKDAVPDHDGLARILCVYPCRRLDLRSSCP